MKARKYIVFALMLGLNLTGFVPWTQAAPVEITSCRTLRRSGAYVLSKNITVSSDSSSDDCLVIQNDFITLDLAGFVIKGRGSGRAIRTDGSLRTGIAIRNGTITDFQTGVALTNTGNNVIVESVRFVDNSGLGVDINETATVKDCLFLRNSQGMRVGFRSRVTGNTATRNTLTGIQVGGGSVVEGNVVSLNGQHGLVASNGCVVLNNTALGNTNFGIAVTCPGNIIGNTTTSNQGANLFLQTPSTACNQSNNVTQ